MSLSKKASKDEPDRYIVSMSYNESVMVYRGIKRSKGPVKSWVVQYKKRTEIFFDRDYQYNWRTSLVEAEAYLRSIFIATGGNGEYPKPKYEVVTVKRPYSKDPNDTIERVKLSRFGGGYKFIDLDSRMTRNDALLKAYYQAEDWHWDFGIKLKLIKTKPNGLHMEELRRLEARYGKS